MENYRNHEKLLSYGTWWLKVEITIYCIVSVLEIWKINSLFQVLVAEWVISGQWAHESWFRILFGQEKIFWIFIEELLFFAPKMKNCPNTSVFIHLITYGSDLCHLPWYDGKRTYSILVHVAITFIHIWPVGLVVWFSLRVREVPGSTPGQALYSFNQFAYQYLNWILQNFFFNAISKHSFQKMNVPIYRSYLL